MAPALASGWFQSVEKHCGHLERGSSWRRACPGNPAQRRVLERQSFPGGPPRSRSCGVAIAERPPPPRARATGAAAPRAAKHATAERVGWVAGPARLPSRPTGTRFAASDPSADALPGGWGGRVCVGTGQEEERRAPLPPFPCRIRTRGRKGAKDGPAQRRFVRAPSGLRRFVCTIACKAKAGDGRRPAGLGLWDWRKISHPVGAPALARSLSLFPPPQLAGSGGGGGAGRRSVHVAPCGG